MAASLKGVDPELKTYLRINKLPDIYEALLTGLAVMCPHDPLQFILDKLRQLREVGIAELQWDMFVEEDMKPNPKVITESNLDYIFNFEDAMVPTPEMYALAYGHHNTKLKKLCFSAWIQFYLLKMHKDENYLKQLLLARQHHDQRMMRQHLQIWKDWVNYRKGRQAMAYQKLHHVCNVAVGRVIFNAWHSHTLDARRQREYFERLERGENMEDDDLFGQGTGEARDSISQLPRKIAIKIFSYVDITDLANCACVCRSWKVITQASLLWSRLDFHKVRKRVTDKVTTRLLYKSRPYLIHLNLRSCDNLSKPTFTSVSECRNIQDLNLSQCSGIDDETVEQVVKGCQILLFLNLSHTNLTDAGLRSISKMCANLQYLSLAFCEKFSDKGLLYLSAGKSCKKLEYLDVSGCLQITPAGFKHLANGCSNVHSIMLNEIPTLNDECVLPMAEKFTKLHTVSFLGSPMLTDAVFKAIALNKKLQVLKIDGNQRISDLSLKLLGKYCSSLEHVYMPDCQRLTDASLKSLSNCKNLAVLNVADCVRVSDTGVRHLVEGACASRLRELNLTSCIRVGDMAMVNLHKRCHSLCYLSVCFCEHISVAGIELLGQTHSLTSLDISGCQCGDQGLSALGNNTRLRDVSLSECIGITDLGLQKFTQQCREVQRLDLSHCMQITDGAIKNLAFCCRMLTILNLAGCRLVTDLSIQYLSGVCHYLGYLDISGCLLITDKALKYLRKGCKKLDVLIMLYCKAITKHAVQKMIRHVSKVSYNDDDVPAFFGY